MGGMDIAIESANVSLKSGLSTLAKITNASGTLVADANGTDGVLKVEDVDFSLPSFDISGKYTVEVNTRASAVDRDALLNGKSVQLILPAGPFMRLSALDASLSFDDLTVSGAKAKLEGNFFIEKSKQKLILTAKAVSASVQVGGEKGELIDGEGAFVLRPNGLAGSLKGVLDLEVPGVAAKTEIFLRINNTGDAISEIITLGADELLIDFKANEGRIFTAILSDLNIEIDNFVYIEGDFVFTSMDKREVVGAPEANIFCWRGPLYARGRF